MSRKTDLEFAEHQKRVKESFIHVDIFNGWHTNLLFFINEQFEYELVFSDKSETIRGHGNLAESLSNALKNLVENTDLSKVQSYYHSGWDDLGSFYISFPNKEKKMRITIENPVGNKGTIYLLESTFGKNSQEHLKAHTQEEEILFEIKEQFEYIFSALIKKYQS